MTEKVVVCVKCRFRKNINEHIMCTHPVSIIYVDRVTEKTSYCSCANMRREGTNACGEQAIFFEPRLHIRLGAKLREMGQNLAYKLKTCWSILFLSDPH